ncbi:MAG: DNA ligase, partial [Thermoplasmata archaeon]
VKPEVVAEVEFLEVTREMELRAPSFRGIRLDKPLRECTIDQLV